MSEPHDLIIPTESEDYIRVMQYLALYESGQRVTKQQVAEHFGVSRQSLDNWIKKWTASGLLQACRDRLIMPTVLEDIQQAHLDVLRAWPDIIRRQIRIAQSSDSDKVSNDTSQWLMEAIVKPAQEQREEPGKDELDYVKGVAGRESFNPLAIADAVFTEAKTASADPTPSALPDQTDAADPHDPR